MTVEFEDEDFDEVDDLLLDDESATERKLAKDLW